MYLLGNIEIMFVCGDGCFVFMVFMFFIYFWFLLVLSYVGTGGEGFSSLGNGCLDGEKFWGLD